MKKLVVVVQFFKMQRTELGMVGDLMSAEIAVGDYLLLNALQEAKAEIANIESLPVD